MPVLNQKAKAENEMRLPEDKRQFVLLPAIAKKRYRLLLEKQTAFEEHPITLLSINTLTEQTNQWVSSLVESVTIT